MKTKKGFKEFAKRIEENNEAFQLMSKAEQRVQIAKDVIERIELKQLQALSFIYLDFNNNDIQGKSAKDIINVGTECTVCAKGAIFLSTIGRVNELTTEELQDLNEDGDPTQTYNKKVSMFTLRQLTLIEAVFERTRQDGFQWGGVFTPSQKQKIKEFHDKYDKDEDRLIAICENIIENKGTFKL